MKKCPFCGADIEKSARFCLYCMRSLTEKEQIISHRKKKPQWLIIIAAIIMTFVVLAVVCFGIQIALENGTPSDKSSVTESAHTPATAITEKYIDSSCTETGSYDEVVYCSVCNEEISRTPKTVAKKPHNHSQKIITPEYLKTEATCIESAVYFYSCTCGDKGTATFRDGDPLNHTHNQKVVDDKYLKSPADCINAAVYYYSCVCGVKGTTTFTDGDTLEHTFDQENTTSTYCKSTATCTEAAIYYYSCVCGAKGNTTFTYGEANGHSYALTWDKNETHHWHKAICEHITEKFGEAEHNYGTDNVCDTCGYDRTVNVSGVELNFSSLALTVEDVEVLIATINPNNATNQNIIWTTSNPSVVTVDTKGKITAVGVGTAIITVTTSDGNKTAQCTVTVSAKICPHATTRTKRENEVDSTCKVTGSYDEVVYCSICEIEISRVKKTIAKKTTHTASEAIQENIVDSTCKDTGSYDEVVYCSVCGCEISKTEKTIPKKNTHTSGTPVNEDIVDSTCKDTGSYDEVVYCSVCGCEMKRISKTISKKPHEYNQKATTTKYLKTDATCTSSAVYYYSCICGEKGTTTFAIGTVLPHSFGDWIVDTVATCMKTGTRHHVCKVCQESVSETYTNPNYHNYDTAWTVDDTHHWHKCLNNGCTSVTGKTVHNITDGFCTDCSVRDVDNETYTRDGNYIYFGEYPQSLKADDVTITANMDVRGYYVGSDGCYYAKVYAEPRSTNYKFQSGQYVQRKNYYFKVEPIRWRILSEDGDTVFIICDSIITNRAFNTTRVSSYENSTIRAWLNNQFYNTVFNELQKCLINVTSVDSINDKVFLLSYNDVTNTSYGFASSDSVCDAARRIIVNDYARATGADMSTSSSYYGCGTWMLREAHFGSYADSMNVLLVGDDGCANYYSIITGECWGVVPALKIRLNNSEYHVDDRGLLYRVNEDRTTCTIVGIGSCTETEIVIPAEIDGMKVTGIGDAAFWGSTLTSIIIPEGVMTIGDNAFGFCKSLASITLPSSVTDIGGYAFYNLNLTSVIFDENSKLQRIGSYAFGNCTKLRRITIPGSVTSIGENAFDNCPRLTYVYITDIAAWCKISFDNYAANPLNGYLANLYLNDKLITDLVIPSGVTIIGDFAFYYCTKFQSITIPYGVKSIGEKAFYYCESLTRIIIPASVTSIGDEAFKNCKRVTSIIIPASVTSIGDGVFKNCESLTSVAIPDGVTRIGNQTFYGCQSITSVTIPDGVTSIGDEVFYGCASLTSIKYGGTEAEWNAITKGSNWDGNAGSYTITYDYLGE